MWTTPDELAWLHKRIPDHLKVQAAPGQQIETWLRSTAAEFVAQFPGRSCESHKAITNVCAFTLLVLQILTFAFSRGCATGMLTIVPSLWMTQVLRLLNPLLPFAYHLYGSPGSPLPSAPGKPTLDFTSPKTPPSIHGLRPTSQSSRTETRPPSPNIPISYPSRNPLPPSPGCRSTKRS